MRPMLARDYVKTVLVDHINLLDQVLAILRDRASRFCVIGGQDVNAYADPVVSPDLDVVVAVDALALVEDELRHRFTVERFPHGLSVSAAGSDLRVQIQTGPRYAPFVERVVECEVLGITMPVAAVEDVLQGNIWAAENPTRRASKRQKDLADIARLLEVRPDLRPQVPESIFSV